MGVFRLNGTNEDPKNVSFLLLILSFFIWQSLPTIIGLVIYLVIRKIKISEWLLIPLGFMIFIAFVLHQSYQYHQVNIFLKCFQDNILLWKLLFKYDASLAAYYQFNHLWPYLVGLPLMMANILQLIGQCGNSPHSDVMSQMAQGKLTKTKEIPINHIEKKLIQLRDEHYDGILLGVSFKSGNPIIIPDFYVNQIVLVLGTTGAGKTITLQRFFKRAIHKGYPLIIVDGKPSKANIDTVTKLAKNSKRQFFGFNCGPYNFYDPLSHGGYTELKDKIITLKDQWDNDYYRTVASDYLQTAIEVLIQTKRQIDLRTIAKCLDLDHLTTLIREADNEELMEKVKPLKQYSREALTGLQAHLNLMANSELGKYFENNSKAFNLHDVIKSNAVAYFALPALRFPDFSKTLGKLIINDIKSIIEPLDSATPIFVIFDEFSVFAGDQVLNLVNMGRGKGVHAVFGTQGLADLKRVDPEFEGQLLNCVNTIICHRLNDQESAEKVSKWIGTQDSYDITVQLDLASNQSALGSASKNKSFIVHPESIKQTLATGEAFFASKITEFKVDKVKVSCYINL